MRTPALALCAPGLLVVFLGAFGCGGGQAAGEGPNAPPNAGAAPSAPAPDIRTQPPASGGPATTTAVTLGNGGDLQGTKLSETRTVAATSASANAAPPPKGPHTHDPGRGPADIRAIIMAHRDEARACYDKGLAAHPGIEGDLVVQWTIDPKGNVTQISLDNSRSQIVEPGVAACVADVIRKIQFAASPGGFETKAFYPFNFHPRQARQQPAGASP
jgi:hypothetical protein